MNIDSPRPQPRQPQATPAQPTASQPMRPIAHHQWHRFSWKKLIALIVILVVLVGAIFGVKYFFGPERPNPNAYQAVFLVNGQVYFGHLTSSGNDYKLTNVFYIQGSDTSSTATDQTEAEKEQNQKLIKLGDELHSPEDAMFISAKNVLFWENMKPDGKVMDAIKDYKK